MKRISLFILPLLLLSSCNFDELQEDPNRVIDAPPSLILTDLTVNSFNTTDASAALASRMMVYLDARDDNQYYSWNRSGFGAYDQLRQTVRMMDEANRTGLTDYAALAKFFQAFHYYQLTMTFGDIPFSDALGGFDGNYQPEYDNQEAVFQGILALLKSANAELLLREDQPALAGDIIYFGDILKWRKAINSFRLRVLMTLSEKVGNTSIEVVSEISEMVGDPTTYPIMESNDDNLALPHYDIADSRYPWFNDQNLIAAYRMETTLIEFFKEREDPRLFQIATVTAQGGDPANFNSYGGLLGSASFDDLQAEAATGVGSSPALRYSQDPVAESTVIMGYSELQFILAEAAARSWAGGDPQIFYNNGITANMEFYGIDQAAIDSNLQHPLVVYNPANGIEQINTQKYLTYFFSSGWEPYYNQRRTGFPVFSTTDFNGGQIPVRWMYPQSETVQNPVNLSKAIQSQFGGDDNINGQMWLVQ